MTPDISGVPGLIALGAKQLHAFYRRSEVRTLLKLTAGEVAVADSVPAEHSKQVSAWVLGIRTDPEVMGGIKRLLDEGDLAATPLIEKRLRQLLSFHENDLDRFGVAELTAKAIEENVAAAKRDERTAAHADAQMTRSLVREEGAATRKVVAAIDEKRAHEGGGGPRHRVEFSLSVRTERVLADLAEHDAEAAEGLAAALDAGGLERAAELIDDPQDWVSQGGSELLIALGRLADQAGSYSTAESAYLKAAEMPDVRNRVREFVRAAVAAESRGDQVRTEELLAAAEKIDPEAPSLAIARARRIEDPEEILAALAEVKPLDDAQEVLLELTRAGAETARGEYARSRTRLQAAELLDPESLMVKEVAANVALFEAQDDLSREGKLDRERLMAAGATLAELAGELGRDGRAGARATLLARASQAYELAGESGRSAELFEQALELGPPPEAAELLAEAALLLQRFDLIASLPLGDGELARLMRASGQLFAESDVPAAVAELDQLIDSADEQVRNRAAFLRLGAASPSHGIDWSDAAEEIVEADKPEAVAVLRGQWLAEQDRLEEAEQVLTPHSDSFQVLRQLIEIAVRRDDFETAKRLSEELLARREEPRDRLNHAGLLARMGETDAARDQFLLVARDESAPKPTRSQAYGRAASLEIERGDFLASARLTEQWLGLDPDNEEAIWLHLFSLARRRSHAEALTFWREHEIEVNQERQALLVAEVLSFGGAPAAETLASLAELSDRFERPEQLEYGLMMTALRTEGSERGDIPDELDARIKQSFAEFPERFPDSDLIQAKKIDENDPAGTFLEEIKPQLEARAEIGERLGEELRRGVTATNVIAAASGRSVGEVWGALRVMPLGYSDEQRASEERNAAAAALDARAAVWDSTATYVVGGLGDPLAETLRNALPASLLAESTFEDITGDEAKMTNQRTGHIAFDLGSGDLIMGEADDAEREAETRRVAGMGEMARGFSVRADLGAVGEEEQLREVLEEEGLSTAARSWPATVALARREGLTVYSDDRYVRLSAQQAGLQSFGTLALLDVLAERGMISAEQRITARARLYRAGAWGLQLSREEFAELLRKDDFEPTRGAHSVLNDFTAWPAGGIEAVEDVLAILQLIHEEAPEKFDRWVHRVLDSIAHTLGGGYEKWARFLTQAALNPFRDPPPIGPDAIQALLRAFRDLKFFRLFPPEPDLIIGAIAESLSFAEDERSRAVYFKALLELLGPEDREAAIKSFVSD